MSAVKITYLAQKKYLKNRKKTAQFLKNLCRFVYSCDISYSAQIGLNLCLPHQGMGVVIGPDVSIGDDVTIYQNVTIGSKANGENYEAACIGNRVMIGAGAVILGKVSVGDNVMIGANSVVLNDVPSDCVVAGIPAKIVKKI